MIVVGLTGSIAIGKSTVASMFSQLGTPVFDADAAVREFYSADGARAVEDMFPGVLVEGRVDRDRLSKLVLVDVKALKQLESLVHPAVARARSAFVDGSRLKGRRQVVVDIPLLFEIGGEFFVDIIIVVSAPESVQRRRALAREGVTEEKFNIILSRQTSNLEKRRRSHFIIDSTGSYEETRDQVKQFLRCTSSLGER